MCECECEQEIREWREKETLEDSSFGFFFKIINMDRDGMLIMYTCY